MKLAFLYPTFHTQIFNENLPTVDDEFGLFPHLGFGWSARVANELGWEVRLFDGLANRSPVEDAIEQVKAWSPDLIGFSAHACQTFVYMLRWAKRVKEETGIPALVGGYEAKNYPEEVLSHDCFDYLCGGDVVSFLPDFLPAFERGHGYEKVPDLFYKVNGEIKSTFPGRRVPFREFPIPDRSIYPNHLYFSHTSQRKFFTIGMSEVGCPYPCSFCCMRNSGFDARTPDQLIQEMRECIALGIHEIDWFDPLMLHDRERVMDMAREHKRLDLDIIWSCRSRIDSLSFHRTDREPDEEMIRTLAEGGCRRIYFGIESGDDEVLQAMMKGQKATSHMRKVLACVKEHGIMALGFFILGAPDDTPESCKKTIDFSLTLPLAYAQYQIAIIKPHTELEKRYIIDATGIDYWREYMRGNLEEHLLPTPWTQMTRPELERMCRYAYFRFYGRPLYALWMVSRIESFEEFMRYIRVGVQLLLRPLRPPTGAHLPWWQRAGRAATTFVEALLTSFNPGARHPVFGQGGGIKGARRLAAKEFDRVETDLQLTRERAQELLAMIAQEKRVQSDAPNFAPGKYLPHFEALRLEAEKAEKEARRRASGNGATGNGGGGGGTGAASETPVARVSIQRDSDL